MTNVSEGRMHTLTNLYFAMRHHAGWIADFWDNGSSVEEIMYLEKLDDELGGYQPEREANKWSMEIMKTGGPEIAFLDSDEEKIAAISKAVAEAYNLYAENFLKDGSYEERMKILSDRAVDQLEKIRHKIRARQLHTNTGAMDTTEWAIAKARQYPLEKLIGGNPMERIPCPFHQGEGKNFMVKNGWGYCFKCGESADSIKWLMQIDGYTFLDAVKRLAAE